MAISLNGTPVATEKALVSSANYTVSLPTGITAGELLCIALLCDSASVTTPSGWAVAGGQSGTSATRQFLYTKTATGAEGSTQDIATTASVNMMAVAFRLGGADTTTPVAQYVAGIEATEDPFTLDANTLSGATAGNWCILQFGTTSTANRTVVTPDADTSLIASNVNGTLAGTQHVFYELLSGTGNSAYSFDMSDSRDYRWGLFEINAAAPASARIVETLIDVSGDPVADATGITVFIWRSEPSDVNDTPDEVLTGQSTDASGNADWTISIGSLSDPDPVWIMAFQGGSTVFTAAKVTPVYE